MKLASYAVDFKQSQGRAVEEPSADGRSPYQRDRDRIIHSSAFRRLQYKTQVMTNSEDGDFRTRLTHTLEVAQLSRSLARRLNLDDDLAELCALAHDLGHPPFGHAGEDALNEKMKNYGGFDHNLQTLSIVRKLECRYGNFDGLNLTWESLEGIGKHNGPFDKNIQNNALVKDLKPKTYASLEAQIAALCDDIAYNHHDLDDGIATGKIQLEAAVAVPAVRRVWDEVLATYPKIERFRQVKELVRRLIDKQVRDALAATRSNLTLMKPQSVEDVRNAGKQIVSFSDKGGAESDELKAFLFEHMYRHYEVNRQAFKAHKILNELFDAFMTHKRLLPPYAQARLAVAVADKTGAELEQKKARIVCDYLASLTDRSAVREYGRMFGEERWS